MTSSTHAQASPGLHPLALLGCVPFVLAGCVADSSGPPLKTDGGGGAGDAAAPEDEDGSAEDTPPVAWSCTHVIGYSQVAQWYEGDGVFESTVDDDRWQLRWKSGAGVDKWRDPDFEGWDQQVRSPCATNSEAPDRVLLSVSGPYGSDEEAWATAIEDTVAVIRQKHPSALEIVLQPVVGGPDHQDCEHDGQRVRASFQHPHIDNAIAQVAGDDVISGASPEIRACADFADRLGHLTMEGAAAVGEDLGAFYLSF